jgi:hypothetical protein
MKRTKKKKKKKILIEYRSRACGQKDYLLKKKSGQMIVYSFSKNLRKAGSTIKVQKAEGWKLIS